MKHGDIRYDPDTGQPFRVDLDNVSLDSEARAMQEDQDDAHPIVTADGQRLRRGDRAYDYYSLKWGVISSDPMFDGWFDFTHDDGHRLLLNGERISTYEPSWAKYPKG